MNKAATDESQQKLYAKRLKRLESIAGIGTWEMDVASGVSTWSDQFFIICGLKPQEFAPTAESGLALIHPDDVDRAMAAVQGALEGKPYAIEKRIVRPNGQVRHIDSRGELEYDSDGKPITLVGTFLDITERKATLEELRRLSTTDELTGCQNRRKGMETLNSEIERANRYNAPLSAVMFDVDYFKQINDVYGHQAGDEVLTTLAGVVMDDTQASDYVIRMGGEEFLVIMPNTDIRQGNILSEKIRRIVAAHRFASNQLPLPQVTISCGTAQYQPGTSPADYLGCIDKALYSAKRAGRNRVVAV